MRLNSSAAVSYTKSLKIKLDRLAKTCKMGDIRGIHPLGEIMSVFATIAIVCTMSQCPEYVIDHGVNKIDAEINTIAHQNIYNKVWEDEKGLTDWLKKYHIGETVFEIVSIDIETKEIPEKDIP